MNVAAIIVVLTLAVMAVQAAVSLQKLQNQTIPDVCDVKFKLDHKNANSETEDFELKAPKTGEPTEFRYLEAINPSGCYRIECVSRNGSDGTIAVASAPPSRDLKGNRVESKKYCPNSAKCNTNNDEERISCKLQV